MCDSLISVIIPVYNVEAYLQRCVNSVMNQTYTNLEIILIDDGSSDSSGEICDKLALMDTRIVVIHQKNQGLGPARNSGLDVMHGQYVGFVDSDDWIAPNMYADMLDILLKTSSDIVTCGRIVTDDNDELGRNFCLEEGRKIIGTDIIRHYLLQKDMNMAACDKLYRADLFEGIRFPGEHMVSEDIVPIYSVLLKANSLYLTGKPYYYYYYRTGSLSKSQFSAKHLGAYYFANEVSCLCKNQYPELSAEADFFRFDFLIILWRMILESQFRGTERDVIFDILIKNIKAILKNKYLYLRHKVFVLLVAIHLDGVSNKAYTVIKMKRKKNR